MTSDAASIVAREAACTRLLEVLDRSARVLDGLDAQTLRRAPDAPSTNTITALLAHTFGAAEAQIVGGVLREQFTRDREGEFRAERDPDELRGRVTESRVRIAAALTRVKAAELDELHPSAAGPRSGWTWLFLAIAHASEHMGQAELTRDLIRAQLPRG